MNTDAPAGTLELLGTREGESVKRGAKKWLRRGCSCQKPTYAKNRERGEEGGQDRESALLAE